MLANGWVKLAKRDAVRRLRFVFCCVVKKGTLRAFKLNVFAFACHCWGLRKNKVKSITNRAQFCQKNVMKFHVVIHLA